MAAYTPPQSQNERPEEELNILILGQTGVGKTSWINSFFNYIRYPTLLKADEAGLEYLIPMEMTIVDDYYNEQTIKLGTSTNEIYKDGESCTKDPFSYEFILGHRLVRLIDTPGIGDSSGIGQDIKNFKKIIQHIQTVQKLHAILILLKPNEARLDVTFQFCLKQLLANLPRSASKNLVFCFTNSRATNYLPGESLKVLKTFIDTSGGDHHQQQDTKIPITLDKEILYCFESECVRFLAAKNFGVKFSPLEFATFGHSWTVSVKETERLFGHITSLKAVDTRTVATINEIRDLVQLLQRPILDVGTIIQDNIANVNRIREEVSKGSQLCQLIEEMVPIKTLTFKKLKAPRTVCNSMSCTIDFQSVAGTGTGTTIVKGQPIPHKHYKVICHDNCKIGAFKVFGWTCECFDWALNCKKCGCGFSRHISINFETSIVEQTDQDLHQKLNEAKTDVEMRTIFISNSQKKIQDLEGEQIEILRASAIFSNFLQANAIVYYNDAVEDYMLALIKAEEEEGAHRGETACKVRGLQKMLTKYREELKVEKEARKLGLGEQGGIRSVRDIFGVMEKLYLLPHLGNSIQSLVQETRGDASSANFEPKLTTINFNLETLGGVVGRTAIMNQLWDHGKKGLSKLFGKDTSPVKPNFDREDKQSDHFYQPPHPNPNEWIQNVEPKTRPILDIPAQAQPTAKSSLIDTVMAKPLPMDE